MRELIKLYWMRRAGDVKRFHTEETSRNQTVAEHCWAVAAILLQTLPPSLIGWDLMIGALRHDNGEQHTGDIPAPSKWAMGEAGKAGLDALEDYISKHCLEAPMPALSVWENIALKRADNLEGMLFALDERIRGNQFMDIIIDRYDRRHIESKLFSKHVADQDKLEELYGSVIAAYHDVRTGQGKFLRAVSASDFWQSPRADGLRASVVPDKPGRAGAGADKLPEPPSGSQQTDSAVPDVRVSSSPSLSELDSMRYY